MFNDLKEDNQGGSNPVGLTPNQNAQTPPPPAQSGGSGMGVPPQQPSATPPEPAKDPNAPVNDMFSDIDPVAGDRPSAVQSGKMNPVSNTNMPSMKQPSPGGMDKMPPGSRPAGGGGARKFLVLIVVIIVIGIAGYAAYYFISNRPVLEDNNTINTNEFLNLNADDNTNTNTDTNDNTNTDTNTNGNVPDETLLDDDFDGLSNAEEKDNGTDPLSPDTDNDGLFDREEVRTWNTNPLIPDSDGDGLTDYEEVSIYRTDPTVKDSDGDTYSDGIEVENGYNPLGDGILTTDLPDDIIEAGAAGDLSTEIACIKEALSGQVAPMMLCFDDGSEITAAEGLICDGDTTPVVDEKFCDRSPLIWPELTPCGIDWEYQSCNSNLENRNVSLTATNGQVTVMCNENECFEL